MDRITQANAALVEEATAASRSLSNKPMRWASSSAGSIGPWRPVPRPMRDGRLTHARSRFRA
jgi:methyl-accepting chemotaxis protein